jgi:hypothetical protein
MSECHACPPIATPAPRDERATAAAANAKHTSGTAISVERAEIRTVAMHAVEPTEEGTGGGRGSFYRMQRSRSFHGRGQDRPRLFGTSEHWVARAKKTHNAAAHISDPAAKQAMLEIAENYEKIAKRAEAREAGVKLEKLR